jgi:hypothetical protein
MPFPLAAIELQVDGLLRVGMSQALDQLPHRHFDAQFLMQFAGQASFERLVGLPFAAGELPEPAQVNIGMALGDEEFPLAEDQGGGNVNYWHGER